MKLEYFKKSLQLYQKLQIKEKQIDLIWSIALCKMQYDPKSMEKDLWQILALQRSLDFRHSLYAQYMLSYVLLLQAKLTDAFEHANLGLENMKWSGLITFWGTFHRGIGQTFAVSGKFDEALAWYKKGLENMTAETYPFWFKTYLNAAYTLRDMGRWQEAMQLVQKTGRKFPARTIQDKIRELTVVGFCYTQLNRAALADDNYSTVFQLIRDDKKSYSELTNEFYMIASFYLERGNAEKADFFVQKALESKRTDMYAFRNRYLLLYKLDSVKGNLRSALQYYFQYRNYNDTIGGDAERSKLDELTLKYQTEKKDQDIKLLKQQGLVQQAELRQNILTRNITIVGAAISLLFLGLLYNRYRLKQRSNNMLESQQNEIIQKNNSLQQMVVEKEFLMKEIHHRVKNNLQIVISLLNTQSKFLNNEEAITAISESRHRMQAMSLIHQKLYQSENVSFVAMPDYIRELVDYLNVSFNAGQRIKFELNIDPIDLDISQAIPVGLILNEAVTNCIKHAFTDQPKGVIRVKMRSMPDGMIFLEISDNGKGLPPNFDFTTSQSLGIRLIRGLIEQIGGELNFSDQDGCRIATTFRQDLVLSSVAV